MNQSLQTLVPEWGCRGRHFHTFAMDILVNLNLNSAPLFFGMQEKSIVMWLWTFLTLRLYFMAFRLAVYVWSFFHLFLSFQVCKHGIYMSLCYMRMQQDLHVISFFVMRNMIANFYIFASVQYQYIYLPSRQGNNDSHDILIWKKIPPIDNILPFLALWNVRNYNFGIKTA